MKKKILIIPASRLLPLRISMLDCPVLNCPPNLEKRRRHSLRKEAGREGDMNRRRIGTEYIR